MSPTVNNTFNTFQELSVNSRPEIQRSDILHILRKQPCITPMELTTMHQTTNITDIGATTLPWDKSTITYPFLDFKEKSLNQTILSYQRLNI